MKMKLVWSCDFCSETNSQKSIMEYHEKICSFNPKNKTCPSCKHNTLSSEICEKGIFDDDVDNCPKWESDNIKLLRKLKIQELNDKSLEM